jgi:hypothetical protein
MAASSREPVDQTAASQGPRVTGLDELRDHGSQLVEVVGKVGGDGLEVAVKGGTRDR